MTEVAGAVLTLYAGGGPVPDDDALARELHSELVEDANNAASAIVDRFNPIAISASVDTVIAVIVGAHPEEVEAWARTEPTDAFMTWGWSVMTLGRPVTSTENDRSIDEPWDQFPVVTR